MDEEEDRSIAVFRKSFPVRSGLSMQSEVFVARVTLIEGLRFRRRCLSREIGQSAVSSSARLFKMAVCRYRRTSARSKPFEHV